MLRKVPLIVILGSTGTGKTKLSLELAERYGGEIISADSMQVYAKLDIATAKATKEEQSRAKHHLLDVATPSEPFTVVSFRNAALPIIETLLAQNKCPIVVGGTNYYIESLLWDILVSPQDPNELDGIDNRPSIDKQSGVSTSKEDPNVGSEDVKNSLFLPQSEMSAMSSELLHNHLRKIDPDSANRIHPNNKRKIMRAIEVYQQTGETLTTKLQAQRQKPGGNRLGGPLRYPHTILFWLRCKQDVLNARLDKRVDAMLEQGLLAEIRAFHNEHNIDKSQTDNSAAYTRGVLQTIGFKEFIPYLEQFNAANDQKIEEYLRLNAYKMPTEEHFKAQKPSSINVTPVQKHKQSQHICERQSQQPPQQHDMHREIELELEAATDADTTTTCPPLPAGLEVLNACLNELKLVTQRYSKKQIKWINNRFLASKDRQVPNLYELDTSDVNLWPAEVYERAVTVIESHRRAEICEIQPMARRQHPGAGLNEETSNFCEICQRHFIGEYQWHLHLKSNKHKKRRESNKKKEKTKEIPLEPKTEDTNV
ncbi:PREDICTED: tRNA dimethylallyltransferase, mitochondrial isoform X1 [Bactrocera latifrons]|uniref:tRNA dimethylallyltransferase, mitochondrial n=1 Tax=Bactrocera latifrons TaxID=174628 RepID=A0A0K8U6X3_BACLA|nr:PREDICTED: tRNA dimethylallyltransferase, mitochondrial isoform X1 [Bactrocera latifrons]